MSILEALLQSRPLPHIPDATGGDLLADGTPIAGAIGSAGAANSTVTASGAENGVQAGADASIPPGNKLKPSYIKYYIDLF